MYFNNINGDLRSIKTVRALYAAMLSLLKKQNFKKITVKEICEEALISRAAFYAHFIDKYDLLKLWMMDKWAENFYRVNSFEKVEQFFNEHANESRRIIKNLIDDADNDTFQILFDFILSAKKLNIDKNCVDEENHKNIVLVNFYVGGIISYLSWQIKNGFPSEVPLINKHFYQMLNDLQNRQSKQEKHRGEI